VNGLIWVLRLEKLTKLGVCWLSLPYWRLALFLHTLPLWTTAIAGAGKLNRQQIA